MEDAITAFFEAFRNNSERDYVALFFGSWDVRLRVRVRRVSYHGCGPRRTRKLSPTSI